MNFVSTRGGCRPFSFSEAVSEGLAPDGGLFVPETLPDISALLPEWEKLPYPKLCAEFMKIFAVDIPAKDIDAIAERAYKRFDTPEIAPLTRLDKDLHLLELYHGPTLAFKDFALQFLGELYEYLLSRSGRKINVLGATSGDTGGAAINGLLGKGNANIFILYPEGRISPLQERQMTCTGAKNVFPIAIRGTFDDAQAIVKELFSDLDFKSAWRLSAVNSINLARILAQCVYYVWAYLRLDKDSRAKVQFIVPTGNFGNVLAGWLVSKMGVGGLSFKVATNRNDILYRLFKTGVYEVSKVCPSHAPSMDIQVSSNFERFIYLSQCGKDAAKVREVMAGFKKSGKWVFDNFAADGFSASRADDELIEKLIVSAYGKYSVVIDPHTACAFADLSFDGTKVVVSTAHPAKFPDLIKKLLGFEAKADSLERLKDKQIVKTVMDADKVLVAAMIEKCGLV